MADIKQKAREVAAKHYYGNDTDNFGCCSAACKNCEHGAPDYLCELCQLQAAIAAALQSAVAEEREECAKAAYATPFRCHSTTDVEFHSGCEQTRDGIVAAIRAKGQKVLDNNTNVR